MNGSLLHFGLGVRVVFLKDFLKMFLRVLLVVSLCVSFVFSLGGVQEASIDGKDIKDVVNFAMKKLNAKTNNYYLYMALETTDATKQVQIFLLILM